MIIAIRLVHRYPTTKINIATYRLIYFLQFASVSSPTVVPDLAAVEEVYIET